MRNNTLSTLVRLTLVPAAVALGASMPAQAQDNSAGKAQPSATASQAATEYRGLRASEMVGMSVRNAKGDNIGQISDMIVNMNSGDVRYAILRFDPGILQGEKLFAVPTTQLRIAADRDDVIYEIDESKLERASIDRDDWNDGTLDDPDYLAGLDKAYGIAQPTRGALAHRVSDLIGKDVNSRAGEKIGEIEDLVVNMAAQEVHYAVLEFDPSWASPEQNYAFPLRSFNLSGDKDELVLDITKDKLQAMKSFPDSRYSGLNDRVWVADIDRYFVTVLPAAGTAGSASSASGDAPAAALFSRLDEDRNGSLEKAEVKDSADVDSNWSRLDSDGDARISRDEFSSHYTVEPGR